MPQGSCGATPRHRPAPAARRAWRIRPGTTPAPWRPPRAASAGARCRPGNVLARPAALRGAGRPGGGGRGGAAPRGYVQCPRAPVMPIPGATQAVTAAAPSVTITGTFATPYQISVEPDWNTTCIYSGKTTSQFTVTFGTPAPAGAGNVAWLGLPPA